MVDSKGTHVSRNPTVANFQVMVRYERGVESDAVMGETQQKKGLKTCIRPLCRLKTYPSPSLSQKSNL
jgi:hypothetical protein